MQPWEFGSLPRAWVGPIVEQVDEVWAYTRAVRDCYVESGVPADRVHVVPLGVDLDRFRPGVPPLPLKTRRTLQVPVRGRHHPPQGLRRAAGRLRQGVHREPTTSAWSSRTWAPAPSIAARRRRRDIARLQATPGAPEIEYIDRPLSEEELAGLYAACDCLVLPYRGEGFGLPIAEAMACGLPVVVTGQGGRPRLLRRVPRLPDPVRRCATSRSGASANGRRWAGRGWPSRTPKRWSAILRHVVAHPDEARAKGAVGERLRAGQPHLGTRRRRRRAAGWRRCGRPIRGRASAYAVLMDGLETRHGRGGCGVSLTMIVKNEET